MQEIEVNWKQFFLINLSQYFRTFLLIFFWDTTGNVKQPRMGPHHIKIFSQINSLKLWLVYLVLNDLETVKLSSNFYPRIICIFIFIPRLFLIYMIQATLFNMKWWAKSCQSQHKAFLEIEEEKAAQSPTCNSIKYSHTLLFWSECKL